MARRHTWAASSMNTNVPHCLRRWGFRQARSAPRAPACFLTCTDAIIGTYRVGDDVRRRATGVPDEVGHVPKPRLALDLLDQLSGSAEQVPVIVTDAGYGRSVSSRQALEERGWCHVVAVDTKETVQVEAAAPFRPPDGGLGPPTRPCYRAPARPRAAPAGRTGRRPQRAERLLERPGPGPLCGPAPGAAGTTTSPSSPPPRPSSLSGATPQKHPPQPQQLPSPRHPAGPPAVLDRHLHHLRPSTHQSQNLTKHY